MMTVADMMSTELYTLKETDSLYDARKLMMEKNIRHIPILNDIGGLAGLVTQRDLFAISISKLTNARDEQRAEFERSVRLRDIMTTDLSVVPARMNLREAALRLQAQRYGCLPVVSRGQLVGIITDSDFVAVAINLLEQLELTEPLDLASDEDEI
jgi:CBS domain-containing protein